MSKHDSTLIEEPIEKPIDKQYWAVIPAAGVGKRMASSIPKQYLPLAGKTVLEHTLLTFLKHPKITGIVIAITEGDPYWQDLEQSLTQTKPIIVAPGGRERCYSVLNALTVLAEKNNVSNPEKQQWVLVHDAARPCLRISDIDRLISQLQESEVGGLLGLPMSDTVKRCNIQHQVLETVERSDLWRALTPQIFPLELLKNALEYAINKGDIVTDEASAIELSGRQPIMIEGSADNIKITHPGDLQLAELFLTSKKFSSENLPTEHKAKPI
jgi:2-C-methyl-D-erythritol 4-phosphate cytidylyltransferase